MPIRPLFSRRAASKATAKRETVFTRFARAIGNGIASFKSGGDGSSNFFGVTWDSGIGWRGINGGRSSTRFPGSDLNWEAEAGPPTLNSVISILSQYVFDKLIEPRVHVVYEKDDGMLQPIPKHPCAQLLLVPNTEYDGDQLLSGMALSYKIDGNAYALKVRGSGDRGAPTELWYIPHWQMYPLPPKNGGPTEWYVYLKPMPSGVPEPTFIPRRNVIHVKNGMSADGNWRMGFAPARAQLRAFVSDNEIDACTAVILRNHGILGTIVSPATAEVEITPDQADELKRRVREQTTGDNRADILALSLPVKIDQINSSAEDMALTTIGDRPTARICASWGVDPSAVGLAPTTKGGGGEKYGSMRKEARESSYEQCMLPMLAAFAKAFTRSLLTDFTTDTAFWVEFDYTKVRDLQENQDALHKRAQGDFDSNLMTQNEARATIGLKPNPNKEVGEKFKFELFPPPAGVLGVIDPAQAGIVGDGVPPDKDPATAPLPEEEDETKDND